MADNPTSTSAPNAEGAPSHGNNSRNDRGGRNQGGRGGRGRGQSRGRGGGRGGSKGFGSKPGGRQKKEMGRNEYNNKSIDKRARNDEEQAAKRQKIQEGGSSAIYATQFSKEEIEAETRKPKRKVAVMIGYAGTGYKGMQINAQEKTIEGDIFKAFVAAGAISKNNSDDPKKSGLVRCARTDKGVHAAGNVISLKLIVEDPDIVEKINENLPPQIRIWGFERTNGSFSCYQLCDSRWYEYLIPTYSFLPPHPQTFLGKKLVESAEQEGIYETHQSLQEDAASFWKDAEDIYVKPILDKLDPEMRELVMAAIHSPEEESEASNKAMKKQAGEERQAIEKKTKEEQAAEVRTEDRQINLDAMEGVETQTPQSPDRIPVVKNESSINEDTAIKPQSEIIWESLGKDSTINEDVAIKKEDATPETPQKDPTNNENAAVKEEGTAPETLAKDSTIKEDAAVKEEGAAPEILSILTPLEIAIKEVKAAYITAKKAYRITDFRRKRVQDALDCYVGTRNFHNYTIQKSYSDPSAKRVIRSFKVGPDPIIINNTEWLSLKVHGQSFMMHQIRKMVAMAALVVRCGASFKIFQDSYGPANISIPKAPSLGLLLERPVFDNYNERAVKEYQREKIDFDKYQKEMDEFKQREIYDRIFREEERDNQFHVFFHHIDHYKTDFFLWVTAGGISAAKQSKAPNRTDPAEDPSDDEADINGEEG